MTQPASSGRAAEVDALAFKIAQLGRQRKRLVARLVDELANEESAAADEQLPVDGAEPSDA